MNCNDLEIEYWKKNILDVTGIVKIQDSKIPKQGCCTVLFMRGKKNQWSICYVLERAVYIYWLPQIGGVACHFSNQLGLEKMRKQTGKAARTPTMSLASK